MKEIPMKRKFEGDVDEEIANGVVTLVKKRCKEVEQLKYDVSKVFFVCSPSVDVDPSFIVTLLSSFDRKVVINHHWASLGSSSSPEVWYGALVSYTCEKVAKSAVDTVQKKYRFLKILLFKEIVDILLKAEFLHPKPFEEITKIVFRAPNIFLDEQIPDVKAFLMLFGKPSNAKLPRSENPDSVILEVSYPTQFQAYAAKIAMDGSGFKKIGFVSVEIIVTENGVEFDKFVRREFKKCIAEKYSNFL